MTRKSSVAAGHEPRLIAGQTDRKIVHLVDHFAIDCQVPVGHEQSSPIIADLDLRLNRHALVRRDDLSAIGPAVTLAHARRLEDGRWTDPPALRRHDFQELQERFQPQRSRPDRVIEEMGLEKPGIGINSRAPLHNPQAVRTASQDQSIDLIDHPPARVREGRIRREHERLGADALSWSLNW